MSYKTILVHVDDSPHAPARVALAATLAVRFGAHLIGAAPTGVSRLLYQSLPPEDKDPTLALHLAFVRERAQAALAAFSQQASTLGLPSFDCCLLDDEAGAGLALHGRVADLIVVGQVDPEQAGPSLLADFPDQVVMHASRPVLVLPYAARVSDAGRRILVSWDASEQAARALLLALPMLKQAESVQLAVFDAPSGGRTLSEAMSAHPLPFLQRHGITATLAVHKVEARRGPHRRDEVGDALLSLAGAEGVDLLVMGAYGQSRFKETLLGGVTRTVFDAMTLPVLMAH